MSEIKTPKTQQSPWPWIIETIFIAGFLWLILNYVYTTDVSETKITFNRNTFLKNRYAEWTDTINEMKEFIDFSNDTSIPVSKHYTENGLLKLQSALNFLADRIDSTNDKVKRSIDTLDKTVAQTDTSSSKYLSELIPAFYAAVKTLIFIQELNYPHLAGNISDLKSTEKSINERRPIAVQFNKIRQFFSKAGSTLRQMKISYADNRTKLSY